MFIVYWFFHRCSTDSLVHWTKLFWIDVILYKKKTSQGTSLYYIFLFWSLSNSTHGKIFSCWSCREDLHYNVSKHSNEITKVCKITCEQMGSTHSLYYTGSFLKKIYENFVRTLETVHNNRGVCIREESVPRGSTVV